MTEPLPIRVIPRIAGASGEPATPPAPPTTPPTTPPADPPPGGDKPSNNPPPKPDPVPYDRFKEVNDALVAARADLKKIEDERKAAEEQRKKDEEAKAKEQGKWQELAEKHEATAKTEKERADGLDTDLKRYKEVVSAQVEARVKELPDEVKALDPGGNDPLARLQWLDKVKPLADKIKGTPPPPGAPRSPAPAGPPAGDDEQARQAQARMMRRNF